MHHVGAKKQIFPLNGEFVVIYHGKKETISLSIKQI